MSAPIATPFAVGARFLGLAEQPGAAQSPAIVAMLQLTDRSVHDDETPWCSAFVNYVAWLLGLPRSNSLAARSWLNVGTAVPLTAARQGYDVVILSRGERPAPAWELHAPGHVAFFAAWRPGQRQVELLGGNQGDRVSLATFDDARVLGVRRLA
jgi:uncharacterized protein (TIGR02594 family)